jgi:hypothetical protein
MALRRGGESESRGQVAAAPVGGDRGEVDAVDSMPRSNPSTSIGE